MGLTLLINKKDTVTVAGVEIRIHPEAPIENIRLCFKGPKEIPIQLSKGTKGSG